MKRYSTQAINVAITEVEEIKDRVSSGEHVLVAELNDEIVGTVTGFEEHESMHACSLAVHPKYQNCGVTHQLMNHLKKMPTIRIATSFFCRQLGP